MATLNLFEEYASSSSSSSESEAIEVKVTELSAVIEGEYGPFRVFKANNKKFTVDARKVTNHQVYRANAEATLTLTKLESGKIVVSGLHLHLPKGSGLFVM